MHRAVGGTMPFGGCMCSGLGREFGRWTIMEYMRAKSVWTPASEEMANPFVIGRASRSTAEPRFPARVET